MGVGLSLFSLSKFLSSPPPLPLPPPSAPFSFPPTSPPPPPLSPPLLPPPLPSLSHPRLAPACPSPVISSKTLRKALFSGPTNSPSRRPEPWPNSASCRSPTLKIFCRAELKKHVLPRLSRPRVGSSRVGSHSCSGGPDPVGPSMPASAPPLTENEESARDVAAADAEEPLPGPPRILEAFFRPCAAAAAAAAVAVAVVIAAVVAVPAAVAAADDDDGVVAEVACCSWRVCFCSSWCCFALFGWPPFLTREGRLFDFFATARSVKRTKMIRQNIRHTIPWNDPYNGRNTHLTTVASSTYRVQTWDNSTALM